MRRNEICQLRLIDIKKQKNIWFIFIADKEETKVKIDNTIRKILIHPQLLDLGCIDYVTSQKRVRKVGCFEN